MTEEERIDMIKFKCILDNREIKEYNCKCCKNYCDDKTKGYNITIIEEDIIFRYDGNNNCCDDLIFRNKEWPYIYANYIPITRSDI